MESALKYEREVQMGDSSSVGKLSRWVRAGSSVLEVGPATGTMTRILAQELSCSVVAIEIDPEAAPLAAPHTTRMIIGNIETLDLDAELGDTRFDYIIFADVLEHLVDPWNTLKKIKKFLQPGGELLTSIPNISHAAVIIDLLQGGFNYRRDGLLDETHLRFFTRESVSNLFQKTGFAIKEWDRTTLRPEFTEFKNSLKMLPRPVRDVLTARDDWDTYQFLARSSVSPISLSLKENSSPAMRTMAERTAFNEAHIVQLFFDCGTGFSEEYSINRPLSPIAEHVEQEFILSTDTPVKAIRVDPIDGSRPLRLLTFSVSTSEGQSILDWSDSDGDLPLFIHAIDIASFVHEGSCYVIPFGDDPQFILPISNELQSKNLRVSISFDFVRSFNTLTRLDDSYTQRKELRELNALVNSLHAYSQSTKVAEIEAIQLPRELDWDYCLSYLQQLFEACKAELHQAHEAQKEAQQTIEETTQTSQQRIKELTYELAVSQMQVHQHLNRLHLTLSSRSWRMTAPLRSVVETLQKLSGIFRLKLSHPRKIIKKLLLKLPFGYRLLTSLGHTKEQDTYQIWRTLNTPTPLQLQSLLKESHAFLLQPLISIVVPTYNTNPIWLEELIESIRAQAYPHWELCIADDASTSEGTIEVLKKYEAEDSRIKVAFRSHNGHISESTNSALEMAKGEFVAFVDHDDIITPDALFEMVHYLNQHPESDVIYSNEDKINEYQQLCQPTFKPKWSPEYFRCFMYIGHLALYRRSLITKVGGFRKGMEGSQDYDLALRIVAQGAKVHHTPKILYHWRMHMDSVAANQESKPYAYKAASQALCEALSEQVAHCKMTTAARVETTSARGIYRPRYELAVQPSVELIRSSGTIDSQRLSYPALQDTGQEFNWDHPDFITSLKRSLSISRAFFVLFLDARVTPLTPQWVEDLIELTIGTSALAVGPKIVSTDTTLNLHAGYSVLPPYLVSNFHSLPLESTGYAARLITVNNVSALSRLCLLARRTAVLDALDDQFKTARGRELSLSMALSRVAPLVWTPHVQVAVDPSLIEARIDLKTELCCCEGEYERLAKKFNFEAFSDPFYPLGLDRTQGDFSIMLAKL